MRKLHDKYFKMAKREGFLARSYYKLQELDHRTRLFRRGDRVLDLGACPGSWLEYILPRIGEDGVACAVDLNVIDKKFKGRVLFRKKDIRDITPDDFSEATDQFNAVVSDMAPKTSGIKATDQARSHELCETAFELAKTMLARGGHFVCKILESPDTPAFRKSLEPHFAQVRTMKPDASRDESMETYLVCQGYGLSEDEFKAANRSRGGGRKRGRRRQTRKKPGAS